MSITVEFTPEEEARLRATAQEKGVEVPQLVKDVVARHLLDTQDGPPAPPRTKNDPVIALLESWLAEAPTDPEEIRAAQEELNDLLHNLNQNRLATGERPILP